MNTIVDNAKNTFATLILSHGAGAGMQHPFMEAIATRLADMGVTVIRFNFPYMDAGRKSPGSPKANINAWQEMITQVASDHGDLPIFMAGKSYGGRMGSHLLADESDLPVRGIIYLGFPLHAPGKDSTDRAAHLSKVPVPQLFLQGKNDKLANIDLMREVTSALTDTDLIEYDHADHSFKTPKSAGISAEEMFDSLTSAILSWMKKHTLQ